MTTLAIQDEDAAARAAFVRGCGAVYQEIKHLAGLGYREIKEIVGTVGRRGWRPLIPWTLIAMGMAIAYRIAFGLPLPNVAEVLGSVAPFVLPTIVGQWTRSIETRSGVANGAPTSAPIEGVIPRPYQP